MNTRQGALVALEGIDGAGKTTQARRLEELLRDTHEVVRTKEPAEGRRGARPLPARPKGARAHEDPARARRLQLVAQAFRAMDLPRMIRIDGRLPAEAITAGILDVLYDGPLASSPRPVETRGGRARTDGDVWTEVASMGEAGQ